MKRYSVNNKMLRRVAAVICMLVLVLALALPCYAEEVDVLLIAPATSAADQSEDAAVDTVISDADVSASDVSASDVSNTDVSASDAQDGSLKDTFKIMGQGMLGIFVVMMLIYMVIVILNATTGKKKEDTTL